VDVTSGGGKKFPILPNFLGFFLVCKMVAQFVPNQKKLVLAILLQQFPGLGGKF
jgi:hypothetical protein